MVNERQDRQGVRTPKDVEQKYNLGESTKDVSQLMAMVNRQAQTISQLGQILSQYIVNTNSRISVLEDAILPQAGAVFCSVDGKSLTDYGLNGNTLCAVMQITDTSEATSFEDLSSAGEYKVSLRVLGSSTIVMLDINLTSSASVTIGSKVYLTEQSGTLCIAYAV